MSDVFLLPDPGEGLTEADIVAWKVAEGDTVTVNQILVEIETAKSLVELPSPQAGVIAELLVAEGDTVDVGSPIVRFGADVDTQGTAGGPDMPAAEAVAGDEGDAAASTGAGDAAPAADEAASGATLVGYGAVSGSSKRRPRRKPAEASAAGAAGAASALAGAQAASEAASAPASAGADVAASRPLAKPPVRKLAKDLGIDLAAVPATGERGEVTRADLRSFAEAAGPQPGVAAAPEAGESAPAAGAGLSGAGAGAQASGTGSGLGGAVRPTAAREEQVPLKGVRKVMANAMVSSAFTAPHVTEGVEIDVTGMMDLVRRLKATKRLGAEVRVSPLLIIAKAVAWAARRHPHMNARLDGETITVRNYVNLGIAAATPRGLLVPNIKDADELGLAQLALELGELVETARAGRTTPAAQAGGTITVTNVGVFGVDWGTPIINPGETAIVAAGRIVKKPWVVDDEIVAREVMTLAVSADHRVVDGETISKFLRDVADALEDPTVLLD
ncbi:dihydrolipoamide acetyltransferase family protein [Brevibacterium album]|uniref:dihydrolipoamide acetyltransferase family protein n=1 Tax=Brevibacterium album TaxID=417948 RepID=UPI00040C7147|nr:dihydrolipoamide acetyltransferase family protein [Brevibacterium album]